MNSSERAVALALYRNIVRATKPFTCTSPSHGQGHVLCSLLYRTGDDDFINYTARYPPPWTHSTRSEIERGNGGSEGGDSSWKDVRLSKEEARDLSRTYDELRRASSSNSDSDSSTHGGEDYDPLSELGLDSDHGAILFRKLLQKVLGEGVHMNFSSGAKEVARRLGDCVRDEFRCPGIDASDRGEKYEGVELVSRGYPDGVRRDTAFLTLRELERKLRWAQSMGFPSSISNTDTDTDTDTEIDTGNDVDTTNKHIHRATATTNLHRRGPTTSQKIRHASARGFLPLPPQNPSSYLRPGSFLVAHPLLTGCFSRTVIAILEHTDPSSAIDDESAIQSGVRISSGGTYGVIVNRYHPTVVDDNTHTNADSKRRRKRRVLQEVFQSKCLPTGIMTAFGDLEVRDGGPVNLSLQMLRTATAEEEGAVGIGGAILPRIMDYQSNETGGRVKPVSQAEDTESAVFFGGDVIRAAQSVIDGEMDRDRFSFLIGASCWEPGQLESEIERGYWIPCAGPPETALKGTCPTATAANTNATATTHRRQGRRQQRVGKSRVEDLWLSAMCALGEGNLAHLMLSKEDGGELYDSNGLACDDF